MFPELHDVKTETSISCKELFDKQSPLVQYRKSENIFLFLFKGALSGLTQFLATESPLKVMKNASYFTSKALFVLKIKFLSLFFGHAAKRLDKKDEVNFKFYDVAAWLKNNCNTHIANISRSKGNQTVKFGQLLECNMRTIFLEKSYTKCSVENSPRLFPEKLKLSIPLDQ